MTTETPRRRKFVRSKRTPTPECVVANSGNQLDTSSSNQVSSLSSSDPAVQLLFSFYQQKCADHILDETSIDWENKFFQLVNDLTALVRALDSSGRQNEMTIHDVKTWLMTLLSNTKPSLTTHLVHKDSREKANKSCKIAKQQLDQHLPVFLGKQLELTEGTTAQDVCRELETIHQESYDDENRTKSESIKLVVLEWKRSTQYQGQRAETTAARTVDKVPNNHHHSQGSSNRHSHKSSSTINTDTKNDNKKASTSNQTATTTPVARQRHGKENNTASYQDASTPLTANLKTRRFWDPKTNHYTTSRHVVDYSANPHAGTYSPNSPVAETKRSATEVGFPPSDFLSAHASPPTPDLCTSPFSTPIDRREIPSGRYGIFS